MYAQGCVKLLGDVCKGECRLLANLYDQPVYNHNAKNVRRGVFIIEDHFVLRMRHLFELALQSRLTR